MPYGAKVCGSCGSAEAVAEFNVARAQEGADGVSVWLCQGCRSIVVSRRAARSQEGLTAAKARGVKLGGYRGSPPTEETRNKAAAALTAKAIEDARPAIAEILKLQRDGKPRLKVTEIADHLNAAGIRTPRGGPWNAKAVYRVLELQEKMETP